MVFSKRFLLFTTGIALLYLLFTIYLRNSILINSTIFAPYPLLFKFTLYSALIEGLWTAMTPLELTTMTVIALLTGINLTLTIQKIRLLRQMGKVHVVAGGSSLLGIVSGGCVSCGLPVLSLLGLSGSLIFLPFKGAELPYLVIGILLVSLCFLIRSNNANLQVCAVPARRGKKTKR